ncbi:PREDICTED: kynurenine formamidase, partial [Nanorana parkeri]|uniref:kynurenine formamidase n=1 Tax=Nanorana parkeri TaxID=125878 RepID=UPI000854AAA6
TRRARDVTHPALNIQYGDRESEKMDVYLPQETSFPLLVYIHGGYWQFLSKEESGFVVPPLVSRGIAVMAMDYDLAPRGDMDLIVSQVRRSVAAALERYPQISAVYLCGHSAGAQLAAMTLSTDWSQYGGVTPDIRGALLVSGVYDLLPLTSTYVNDALQMSQEAAVRNSPGQLTKLLKNNADNCHLIIVVAEHDSPEFHRQSREYFQSLEDLGVSVSYRQVEDADHFDVIERLSREDYVLTQLLLEMILKQ